MNDLLIPIWVIATVLGGIGIYFLFEHIILPIIANCVERYEAYKEKKYFAKLEVEQREREVIAEMNKRAWEQERAKCNKIKFHIACAKHNYGPLTSEYPDRAKPLPCDSDDDTLIKYISMHRFIHNPNVPPYKRMQQ